MGAAKLVTTKPLPLLPLLGEQFGLLIIVLSSTRDNGNMICWKKLHFLDPSGLPRPYEVGNDHSRVVSSRETDHDR